jgi:hypothetical protein
MSSLFLVAILSFIIDEHCQLIFGFLEVLLYDMSSNVVSESGMLGEAMDNSFLCCSTLCLKCTDNACHFLHHHPIGALHILILQLEIKLTIVPL